MRCRRRYCIIVVLMLIGLFTFPPTGYILSVAIHTQTDNFGLFGVGDMMNNFASMTKCMPHMTDKSCFQNSLASANAKLYTWHPGFAIKPQANKTLGPHAFGHKAYRSTCYDTKMGRTPTPFSNMNILTGVMDKDMDKLLVNFATGDPEWVKRRSLIMDNFASVFAEHGSFESIVVPQGMTRVPGYPSVHQVRDFVGLNIFRQMFAVDVNTELSAMFDYGKMMKKMMKMIRTTKLLMDIPAWMNIRTTKLLMMTPQKIRTWARRVFQILTFMRRVPFMRRGDAGVRANLLMMRGMMKGTKLLMARSIAKVQKLIMAMAMKFMAGSISEMAATRKALLEKAKTSVAAKKFMAAADQSGLNGETRLRDLIWIIMFAGYEDTGYLVIETLNAIRHNPVEMLKLYRKDPDAFILEAARMFPAGTGVRGLNQLYRLELSSELSVETVHGHQKVFPPGTQVTIDISGANRDPTVFKDPEKFDPTRENLERILTWNNEVGDMRKCNSTAGFPACESAPRPCPGTFLAIRVAKAALDFFVPGVEEMIGKKVEL